MKAMILAAGRGERMRPLTDYLPKPLLCVAGKPLIEFHIERLRDIGIREIVINHAWLGQKIVDALGDGGKWGVHIEYSAESHALETLGGIVKALPLLGHEPFYVVNGDIYCDFDLRQLHLREAVLADVVLVPNPMHHPDGDFALQGAYLHNDLSLRWTFAGMALYAPAFFDGVAQGKSPLAPLLREHIAKRCVTGHLYQGLWRDIGTPERLRELDSELQQRKC